MPKTGSLIVHHQPRNWYAPGIPYFNEWYYLAIMKGRDPSSLLIYAFDFLDSHCYHLNTRLSWITQ
jgi:hypothetical protein